MNGRTLFFLLMLSVVVIACGDSEESVSGPSGKYTYMGFDMPSEYSFYAIGQNGSMSYFDVSGSSLEEEYNVVTASSSDFLTEIEMEIIPFYEGIEMDVPNESSLVYAFNSPSDPSENYSFPTSYSLNGGLINIEGITSTNPGNSNWLYQYDAGEDLIFLTIESIIFSDHDPELDQRRVIPVVKAGEVVEGDFDASKDAFTFTPTDSIGIGHGRIIYKKQ